MAASIATFVLSKVPAWQGSHLFSVCHKALTGCQPFQSASPNLGQWISEFALALSNKQRDWPKNMWNWNQHTPRKRRKSIIKHERSAVPLHWCKGSDPEWPWRSLERGDPNLHSSMQTGFLFTFENSRYHREPPFIVATTTYLVVVQIYAVKRSHRVQISLIRNTFLSCLSVTANNETAPISWKSRVSNWIYLLRI